MRNFIKIISLTLSLALVALCCGCQGSVGKNDDDTKIYTNIKGATTLSNTEITADTYNIKVCSFNVGNWYAGTHYGVPDPDHEWFGGDPTKQGVKVQRWLDARAAWDADIFGLQECQPELVYNYYTDEQLANYTGDMEGVKVTPDEFLSAKEGYKYAIGTGKIRWNNLSMYNGFLAKEGLNVTDFEIGHICDDEAVFNRVYAKAYVTVGKVKIAIFSFHTSPTPHENQMPSGYNAEEVKQLRIQQMIDIKELCAKEDYFIAFGDFNTGDSNDFQTFRDAGFNMANHSTFGSINTVDRVDEHNPIDNIITSSNIAITNAYSMYEWIGNSDHLPIVAELTIDPDAKSQVNTNQTTEDGFIDGYYKPTPKQDIAERE